MSNAAGIPAGAIALHFAGRFSSGRSPGPERQARSFPGPPLALRAGAGLLRHRSATATASFSYRRSRHAVNAVRDERVPADRLPVRVRVEARLAGPLAPVEIRIVAVK